MAPDVTATAPPAKTEDGKAASAPHGRAARRRARNVPLVDEVATTARRLARRTCAKAVAAPWISGLRPAPRTSKTCPVAAKHSDSAAAIAALAEATNAHDIDAFVTLFAEDYDS